MISKIGKNSPVRKNEQITILDAQLSNQNQNIDASGDIANEKKLSEAA